MSCDIRKYRTMKLGGEYGGEDDMTLTAFVGGKSDHSIQFTIGGKYCCLSQKALEDLIHTINKRIKCVEGWTATGNERDDIEYKS